jgi:hypothetical protein
MLAAPAVTQLRVLAEPELTAVGVAVNEVMVGFAPFTVKLRDAGVAAAQMPLPACEAWMVHVPAVTNVAVVPLTAQTLVVCEAKLTAKPEVAVADSASGVPTVWVTGVLKVIVCASAVTVKVCETGVAAANVLLPAWVAWIVQVPEVTKVAM